MRFRQFGWAALVLALLLAAILTRPAGSGRVARHDAYIWQLHWTPALESAVARDARLFQVWHVLAAEISPTDGVSLPDVDWPPVTAGGHGVVPVIRIEGNIPPGRVAKLIAEIARVRAALPGEAQAGLEIDHDSATSRLANYAAFLRALRAALPPGVSLSATVLPTWLGAADFAAVAGALDMLVLQVHAIDDPLLGLFNADRARRWVSALEWRTGRPFLVALPAYGARVAARQGRLVAVSAEMTALDGQAGAEISANPLDVSAFLSSLRSSPPPGLRGIVWFRLPTADDRRAWSDETLRAVIRGGAMQAAAPVIVTRPGDNGAANIFVNNPGDIDIPLPARIALPSGCISADGIGQYELDGFSLRARGQALLPAHSGQAAGWMRCGGAGGLHAEH